MDDPQRDVGSTAATDTPVEGWMLREDIVREVLARLARGECVKAIARERGVDKKTIKRWRARGEWRPRTTAAQAKAIDAYRLFLARRGPEVGWNGMVLHRELRTQGFTGGYQQVQRALQPVRTTRRWAARATVRFETAPGEQAQVDFGCLCRSLLIRQPFVVRTATRMSAARLCQVLCAGRSRECARPPQRNVERDRAP